MANLVSAKVGEAEFDTKYSDVAQYGRIQFWEERYANEAEDFEWYYPYEYFAEVIADSVPKDAPILVAGSGTSHFPEDLISDGFTDVTANDISRVAMNKIQIRNKTEFPELKYLQANMTDTNVPAGSFKVVIDKALLDTLLCTSAGSITVAQYIVEVERLLSDDGVFIIISHGNPEQRLQYLEQYDIEEPYYTPWYIEVQALVKPKILDEENLDADDPDSLYWIYICTKNAELVHKKMAKEGKIEKTVVHKKDTRKKASHML